MPSRLNKCDIFTIKSRFDSKTKSYDDSNNWNIVSACSICTNTSECKYNSSDIVSSGTCLHFNYSNSTILTKLYYDVNNPRSLNKIIDFRNGNV